MAHQNDIVIRRATPEDAASICHLLIRSITELCGADHQNDPNILARWTDNKTPEKMTSWIKDPHSALFVAVDATQILAVGVVAEDGEIGLNYVLPEARFQGLSRQMIQTLENQARKQGNTTCFLSSTETARRFYKSQGYTEKGSQTGRLAPVTYAMVKIFQDLA